MDPNKPSCHLCKSDLKLFEDFTAFQQITSDCQPWQASGQLGICTSCGSIQKPTTLKWFEDIKKIYSNYNLYIQGDGQEQPIFDQTSGHYLPRSVVITKWVNQQISLPSQGKLLDVGCGTGVFLKAFQNIYPNWQMFGLEHDEKNKKVIESIPNVKKLITEPVSEITEIFNFISLIHSLEHIPNPIEFLKSLTNVVEDDGHILIEVPNVDQSPFDILIADHCSHFSISTLEYCVNEAGLEVEISLADVAPKEISLIANCRSRKRHNKVLKANSIENSIDQIKEQIKFLNRLLEQAEKQKGTIGVFGTSISATWLASSFRDKISFFVDEDINRIGRRHLDLPIIGITSVPKDCKILMPLRYDIAQNIVKRLNVISLLLPPQNKL